MDTRLKDFMEDNFDFVTFKKIGIYSKDTKKRDYEAQAKRICEIFDFESVYEYSAMGIDIITETPTSVNGKFADTIDGKGEFQRGEGFHLSTCEDDFVCPVCTKEQSASDHAAYNRSPFHAIVKCKGCKRKLQLNSGMCGELFVLEVPTK